MRIYQFGPFSLDIAAYQLRRGDEVLPIQPKVFNLLEYLLAHADRAISKHELLEQVWPDAIVGEAALSQAIRQARRAMGEEEGGQVILTVRGRGYRIGIDVTVEEVSPAELPAPPPETPPELIPPDRVPADPSLPDEPVVAVPEAEVPPFLPPPPESARFRPRLRTVVIVAAVASVGVAFAWLGAPRLRPPERTRFEPGGSFPPTSVAVLPFSDLSNEGDQQVFSYGLAEEVLTTLAGIDGLRVVARRSAFQFEGGDHDVRTIGAMLSVGSVVEGSVRRTEDRIRLSAQLVDTATGFQVWSHTYDRRLDDVFAVQEELARAVVAAIRVELLESQTVRSRRHSQRNFEAYQAFLEARATSRLRTKDSIRSAIELFERALSLDPGYGDAYAGLAHGLILQWDYASREPRSGPLLARAEAAARTAVELDPLSPAAQAAWGNVLAMRRRDWKTANVALQRAVELNPGLAWVREIYGSFLLQMGRLEEGGEQLRIALDLDPLSPIVNRNVGRYHAYRGDTAQALDYLWRSLELNPEEPQAPSLLWIVYSREGRGDEALEAVVRLAPPATRPPLLVAGRLLGMRTTLAALLAAVRPVEPCPIGAHIAAQAYAYLGWRDSMLACLERSLERDFGYTASNPLFERYGDDPAFREILSRAGLDAG